MANEIALTAAKISVVNLDEAEIRPVTLAEAVTAGQAAYQVAASGKFGIADANASGKQQFRGIFLQAGGAGQTVDMLIKGDVAGFTLSGMNYDDPAYLSDTVGALSTAVGTMTVNCGRVVARNDSAKTKVLHICADWNRIWA